MDMEPPPDDLETILRKEMRAGERLLWQGRMMSRVGCAQMAIWLFAIPWTAFALFWTGMAWAMTRDVADGFMAYLFPLFGVPFILIGLGMLTSPFLRSISAKYTIFGVTNQRVIRLFQRKSLRTETIDASQVGNIDRTERSDGSGTLTITVTNHSDSRGRPTRFKLGPVEDVRGAEDRIREIAKA